MSELSGEQDASWKSRDKLAEQLVPLLNHYDVKWRGHGWIYVDHQPDNVATAQRIVTDLSRRLGVPAQQIRARLEELGWLKEARYTSPCRIEAVRSPKIEPHSFYDDDFIGDENVDSEYD